MRSLKPLLLGSGRSHEDLEDVWKYGEYKIARQVSVFPNILLAMKEGVKEVCVDMWGGLPQVIREVFSNAKTVIDRFHIQKLINKALNKIRLTLKINGFKN